MNPLLPPRPSRVLLVRLSSLGDVVCAMPLAVALRRLFPKAEILWALEPNAAPLLEGHGSGAVAVLVPRRGGPAVRCRTVGILRNLRPDLVVDAQGNTKSGVVARLSSRGAPVLGFAREDVREWPNLLLTTVKAPPAGETHTVRRNMALLRALGSDPPAGALDYGLAPLPAEVEAGREALRRAGVPEGKPLVLVHVGKLADVRAWTIEGIVALAREMVRRGMAVALEGPDILPDAARRDLEALSPLGVADLTRVLPLRVLLGLLGHLAAERKERGIDHVVVSPDTMLPHLAEAMGIPVVLLAGPQDPARTGPLGGRTRIVHAWEGLPCAPCRKRRCFHTEERACMRRITPATVAAAVEEVLASETR